MCDDDKEIEHTSLRPSLAQKNKHYFENGRVVTIHLAIVILEKGVRRHFLM